ncbi:MAG: HD domain-containing protein [Crocinitomicaceae bacterium]
MDENRRAEIITHIEEYLKEAFSGESTGHDWFHIDRVRKNASLICKDEDADDFVVEIAALLHDIADHKFVENADQVAEDRINDILLNEGLSADVIDQVQHIVANCSFKGGLENKMKTLEGKIVQDADRLDAIGAIGVARTFAFGGKFGNEIYNPEVAPSTFKSAEEYRKKRTHTINHFYEKLLLLKDGMNTETGKKLASDRHAFMEQYLDQFYAEWEGRR